MTSQNDGDLELKAERGDAVTAVETLGELFAGPGARDYLGEPVSIGEHMLQAAALAEAAGAEPPLVAAALLHDVGHLRPRRPRSRRCRTRGTRSRCAGGTTRPRTRRSPRRGSRTSRRYLRRWPGPERDSALTAVELCTLNATALPT